MTDARRCSHQTLEEIRIDAVRRVEAGESSEAVIPGLGINRPTIYRWLAAYHYGGEESFACQADRGCVCATTVGLEQSVHGAHAAQVTALIKQRSMHTGRGHVDKAFAAQSDHYQLPLSLAQGQGSEPPRVSRRPVGLSQTGAA